MLLRNLSNTSNPSFTTTTGTLPTLLDVSNTFRFVSSWMESLSGELLNFFLLFFQFFATNTFLNYKFELYGWKVVEYYRHSLQDRNNPELGLKNPMCTVFPTVTSCTIPNVGASGVAQYHNGLCVLTQNIINEKIYLILWFWYAFLGPVSVIYFCYRLITLLFHGVRYSLLYRKVTPDEIARFVADSYI